MKKTRFLLTTIAVLLCSVMAHAHDFEIDGIRYDITSFTDLTVKASSVSESITSELSIPSKVQFNGKELNVIEVSDEFAISNTTISSLIINDGITYIGEKAFKNCTNLTTINIAQSVTQIGKECFYGCTALKNFNNQGIITLGIKSFAECNNLEEISIENLDSLKEGTFINCTKLTNCNLPNIKSIEKEAFKNCQSLKEYNIPNNVTSIGESAFEGCSNISMIIIPNNVYELGKNAFNHCTSLTSISIGSGLTFLPWVFEECNNLSDIRIEDSPTTLIFDYTGDRTYSSNDNNGAINKTEYYYYPSSAMFSGKNLKNLYIGRNLATKTYLFKRYYQNGAYTQNQYYYAPNPPFSESKIESLTIGNLVSDLKMQYIEVNPYTRGQKIGIWNGAFQNCTNLDTITILSIATKIPENTFKDCIKISSLNVPNSVKEIGNNAFSNCKELKQITLGNNLVTIGENAFDSCESLVEINIKSPIPPTYKTGFSSAKYINTKLNVPSINLDSYQNAEPWKNFWNIAGKNELISLFELDNINYSVIEDKNVEIINNNISEPTNLLIKNEIEYYEGLINGDIEESESCEENEKNPNLGITNISGIINVQPRHFVESNDFIDGMFA